MYGVSRCGWGLASKFPAKRIAGRRFAVNRSVRSFHSGAPKRLYNPFGLPSTSSPPENPSEQQDNAITTDADIKNVQEVTETGEAKESSSDPNGDGAARNGYQGAISRRRRNNNSRPKEIPPIHLPYWFINNNIKLFDEKRPLMAGVLDLSGGDSDSVNVPGNTSLHPSRLNENRERTNGIRQAVNSLDASTKEALNPLANRVYDSQSAAEQTLTDAPSYRLNRHIYQEIQSYISAALNLSHTDSSSSFPASKSHLKLHCPIDGGDYMLEKIVDNVAESIDADIIRLDAQDIAEIASEYIKEGREATSNSLWTLGYDTWQTFFPAPKQLDSEEMQEEAAEEDEDEDDADSRESRRPHRTGHMTAIPIMSLSGAGSVQDIINKLSDNASGMVAKAMGGRSSGRGSAHAFPSLQMQDSSQQWNELKLNALLEVLIESNTNKRTAASAPAWTENQPESEQQSQVAVPETEDETTNSKDLVPETNGHPAEGVPKTIVLVRGMKELSATQKGSVILEKLFDSVERKRKHFGQRIMLVGTTASAELTPEISKSGIESLQTENPDSVYRTIVVTPEDAGPAGGLFYSEERRLTRELNARLIRDVARRIAPASIEGFLEVRDILDPECWKQADMKELAMSLEDELLSFDEIHRNVLAAVGLPGANESLSVRHLITAVDMLEESDTAKAEWAESERQLQRKTDDGEKTPATANDTRLKRLRKTCNHHEKVLLRGVVNPENIRVTWGDVHAPSETKDALQTLTTLSLTRPDAFKYGVLATDKISGALLYGPPGTGKTLLAKAVAKQSGATVLEVSGSDLYDMYVGEAEKNVRAVFSLAKKLSPCVVFIDEADAIFASRGSGTNRNSHRELINQFLREWDGMTETNAFIMLATNRPFDLDDAALRRLPRRILVDLPVEKDREAILGIHLKNEQVDPSVTLSDLAAKTQLFSGSDLKNVAVSAALAAVKEETEAAAAHKGDTPFQYAEKRTLLPRHFERALEEITASVSDDMSSLGAIRKFDEKYGDKRGRKKRASYGFATEADGKGDTNKVRT